MSIEEYYNLGTYHRLVTTSSSDAQRWFNRGLIWCSGFNHDEAVNCFEKAIASDPHCAMAHWGLAYALGPNYNKPWEAFDDQELDETIVRTRATVAEAKEIIANKPFSPVEKALIDALEFRYQPPNHDRKSPSIWNKEYVIAMETVYKNFSDDLDVATLYADALMNLTPWKLWNIRTGLPSEKARPLEVKRVLERALASNGGLEHPGLLHLYIHLMEMSQTPEAALTMADHLRGLVPDSGHLNHMPTHLDIMCGDYRRAIASNTDAIRADEKFLAIAGPLNFYTLYRVHNYHFRIYAAMFSGQSKIALETGAHVKAMITEELLRVKSPPMADWLEGLHGTAIHTLIRFGCWQEIIDQEFPEDKELYCVTTAMLHYAKGVAFAATTRVNAAEQQRDLFVTALTRVPPSRTLFNNRCVNILAVAKEMLNGEIEYRRGHFDKAFDHLRQSIKIDDALPFDEPWGWMQPTRHAYGALLLEQGHVEMAAAVYSADLGIDSTLPRPLQHPNNVWALHGYHECLVKLGRKAEARIVESQLKLALAIADVPIKSSCFCRLELCKL